MTDREKHSKIPLSEIHAETRDRIASMDEAGRNPDEIANDEVLLGSSFSFRDHSINILYWDSAQSTVASPPDELVTQLAGQVYGFNITVEYRGYEWLVSELSIHNNELSIGEIIGEDITVANMAIVRLEDIDLDIDFMGDKN